jgi:hypothetical protein
VLPPGGAKDIRAWAIAQRLDCTDAWSDAGERLLAELHGHYIDVPVVASAESSEDDAADLAAEEDGPDLEYLPMLDRPGYLPRGWSILLAGYPRAGKTELITSCMPAWLDSGETVLYLTEEPRSMWRLRLRKAGWTRRGLRLLYALGRSTEELFARARDGPETVIIIDTIRNLGILPEDDSDNSAVARALAPWIAMAREKGKTLILLHHMRKGAGDHGEGISGGHAIFGAVDVALELRRDSRPERRLVKGYARLIQIEELLYELDSTGRLVALGDPTSIGLLEVETRVTDVLGPDWVKTAEVAQMLEEPRPGDEILRQALNAAARAGKIERDPPISEGPARGKSYRWRRA